MSATKNECEIVNRLSRKVEKELSDNMTLVNASLTEINEKLEDMAVIDDTTASTTTTYSSEKIEDLIDDIPTGAEIDDTTASTTTTYSSEKIEDLISDIPTGAEIDDTTASTTTTYSSEKIEDLISDIPTGAEIDDSTEALTTTWSSSKIKTEIDAGGGGGSDVIDDTNITTTTTFSSDLIVDFVMNKDSFIKNISDQFGRITPDLTQVATITLNEVLLSRGFEMLYTQQDGFSTDRSGVVTIQLVGNTTGTVYIEKSYTGYDLIPEGSTHINISDDFMFDAGDIDLTDTALLYKIKAVNGPWSTSFPYTFKLMAIPFNTYNS